MKLATPVVTQYWKECYFTVEGAPGPCLSLLPFLVCWNPEWNTAVFPYVIPGVGDTGDRRVAVLRPVFRAEPLCHPLSGQGPGFLLHGKWAFWGLRRTSVRMTALLPGSKCAELCSGGRPLLCVPKNSFFILVYPHPRVFFLFLFLERVERRGRETPM